MSGQKIIEALKEAAAGDLARVTINGETWARVKDIHSDQQRIMEINNTLRDSLFAIKSLVVDDKIPHWKDDWATTCTRGQIADIVDTVVK